MPKNLAFYKPNTVQIELVQGCNRSCQFCGTNGFKHKINCIEQKVLKKQCKLIQESGYNPRILIAGHGENTLHPHFFECIKLMRKTMPNAWMQILTNGYLIKKDLNNITKMFDAGLNDVTMDEYSDSKFDRAEIQAILAEYEKTSGIKVEFQIMKKGIPLYAPKVPKNHRLLVIPAIDEKEITVSRKLTNHCGAGMPPKSDYTDRVCTRIFREMSFRWDGWVCLCCQDFRGQFQIANCMDDNIKTFDDLWRHETFEAARRILYHKKRIFFPCNVCDHIPMRAGLIPDHLGKEDLEKPTKVDWKLVNEVSRREPRTELIPREWEKDGLTTADNLNLED